MHSSAQAEWGAEVLRSAQGPPWLDVGLGRRKPAQRAAPPAGAGGAQKGLTFLHKVEYLMHRSFGGDPGAPVRGEHP